MSRRSLDSDYDSQLPALIATIGTRQFLPDLIFRLLDAAVHRQRVEGVRPGNSPRETRRDHRNHTSERRFANRIAASIVRFTDARLQLMSFASTCVNPLVYCFMNKRFRAGFLNAFLICVPGVERNKWGSTKRNAAL